MGSRCTLYINHSKRNVINKNITLMFFVDIEYKEVTDILHPIIKLKYDSSLNMNDCNYIYLNKFNRYYFIDKIELINQVWICTLSVDVWYSYKNKILNAKGYCIRNSKKLADKNGIFYDTSYPVRCDRVTSKLKVGSVGTTNEYYLTVVGGAS